MNRSQASLLFFSLSVFLLISGVFPGLSRAEHPARMQLESSIDRILEVLRNPDLKARPQERREKLREIASQRFDYRKMTQLSLGQHWKERSESEKEEVTGLFSKLLEDTYMAKIETYTNEKVVYAGERTAKRKAQIDTKIVTQSLEIPIDYRMYEKTEGNWMVYDIVIEGVSMIGNYRSQFGQILERGSFEALIDKLKQK